MIIPLRVVQALAPWIVKSRARAIDLELYDFILGRNLYLRIPNISPSPYEARISLFLREVRGFLFAGNEPNAEGQQEQKQSRCE